MGRAPKRLAFIGNPQERVARVRLQAMISSLAIAVQLGTRARHDAILAGDRRFDGCSLTAMTDAH